MAHWPANSLRLGATVALTLAVVGCVTPPPYAPPGLPAFLEEGTLVGGPAPARRELPCKPTLLPPRGSGTGLPEQVTLPQAIRECVFANLRLRAGAEKVRQAQAELTSASLVPNPLLYLDTQLNPFPGTHFTPTKQGGPPQDDVTVNFPIDWLLFGKRVTQMQAARLGVDAAAADLADLVRQRVAATVTAYYEVLLARELLALARQDAEDVRRIEAIAREQLRLGGGKAIDIDRIRLEVLDRRREVRKRELELAAARNKLRPLLGRTAIESDFGVLGTLDVAVPAAPPDLDAALVQAERQRPDLIARTRQLARAEADVCAERRKAWPLVNVQPIFTYQFQRTTIGFPDARSWGVAMTSTLPFTDRNQGNILKALSAQREAAATYQADLAEVRAEVAQAVETYRISLEIITTEDPKTLEAARSVRDRMEQAFKAGGVRLLEVLDAQRAYRDRLRTTIGNKSDYWQALYRLNAAVGGRFLEQPP